MSGASGFAGSPESRTSGPDGRPDATRGLYGISVAAELVGSAPQSLRLYETRGLISPARSQGGTRRYSDDDLVRLRQIGRLLDDGLNLAGIAAVLALQAANRDLQTQLDQTRQLASAPRWRRTDGDRPTPRSG
jgi:DNA-binding transcriptional MerR regulator